MVKTVIDTGIPALELEVILRLAQLPEWGRKRSVISKKGEVVPRYKQIFRAIILPLRGPA